MYHMVEYQDLRTTHAQHDVPYKPPGRLLSTASLPEHLETDILTRDFRVHELQSCFSTLGDSHRLSMNGFALEEAPSGARTGCAAHRAKRLTGVESQLYVHAHSRPRAAVAALSKCGRQYWALAESFAGEAALRDLPENVLELIFCCCSSPTQVSLAHTSQLFRKYWKTLKLYEGPYGLCVTCRNKHRQQLHDGAAAIACHVNLLIYARRLEGPVLIDMAV